MTNNCLPGFTCQSQPSPLLFKCEAIHASFSPLLNVRLCDCMLSRCIVQIKLL